MGLMQAAFQAGIAMPGRLSIVGFDDIDFAAYTIPPLTTISQDGVEMGRVAADALSDMIDNGRDRAEVDDVVSNHASSSVDRPLPRPAEAGGRARAA